MTRRPRSVLVAVDFGEASARAITLGGAIAAGSQATLRLMHAESLEAPPYFTHDQIEALERQRQSARAQAMQFLTRFGRHHTDYPFGAFICDGPPVEAIRQDAASADLVLMGTHGRRGPLRWWLGSVAERVLQDTKRPLLIARADTPANAAAVFARVVAMRLDGGDLSTASAYADALTQWVGGHRASADPTLIVVAIPAFATASWLDTHAEPLVRSASPPVLFIPQSLEGASS